VGGALPVAELVELLSAVGLTEVEVTERFACFSGTSAEEKLGANLWIGGANVRARKPR
jgi:arsenite methyltransferase